MAERQNQDVLSSHYRKILGEDAADDGSDDDADFLSVKRVLKDDDQLDAAAGTSTTATTTTTEPKVIKLGNSELIIDSNRREKLLKSKKKLLKYMDRGTKLVFDDDGNAHPVYELQDEDDFAQQGPADHLRKQFVDAETEKVKEADVGDKQAAKDRRREKRERQKAREREEELAETEGGVAQLGGDSEDDQDPLALLRSLPTPGDGEGSGGSGGEEEEPPKKKARKWFQDDSDQEEEERKQKKRKGGKRVIEMAEEPDNLEDLEALAAGLLED
jgi:ATP-dependent RNA helicase DDX10/DBP4